MADAISEGKPTVLIVEDEPLLRTVLAAYLEECEFQVLSAENADRARELLESGAVSIDLVISDIRMPGTLDGVGLARWIAEHRAHLPVILTSSDEMPARHASALGVRAPFFNKPYDFAALALQVQRTLRRRSST